MICLLLLLLYLVVMEIRAWGHLERVCYSCCIYPLVKIFRFQILSCRSILPASWDLFHIFSQMRGSTTISINSKILLSCGTDQPLLFESYSDDSVRHTRHNTAIDHVTPQGWEDLGDTLFCPQIFTVTLEVVLASGKHGRGSLLPSSSLMLSPTFIVPFFPQNLQIPHAHILGL